MDIKQLQQDVKALSQKLDTKSPEQRVMYLVSELGELVDEVIEFRNANELSPDDLNDIRERIGLEIYDLIWNAVDLANMLDIDLEGAFEKKIAINKNRHWQRSGYVD